MRLSRAAESECGPSGEEPLSAWVYAAWFIHSHHLSLEAAVGRFTWRTTRSPGHMGGEGEGNERVAMSSRKHDVERTRGAVLGFKQSPSSD